MNPGSEDEGELLVRTRLFGVAVALALSPGIFAAAPALASTVVFSLSPATGVSGNQPASDLPLDLGMNFTVNSSVTVDSLGAFTNGSSLIDVRLYDVTTNSVVVTTTVGSPIGGSNYAFNSFGPPATLTPGLYQINATYNSSLNKDFNPFEAGGGSASVIFNSLGGKLTFGGDFYHLGGSGALAVTPDLLSPNGYGAGTFTVSATPLPPTWLMLLSAFVGLGFFAYRGTNKDSAAVAAA